LIWIKKLDVSQWAVVAHWHRRLCFVWCWHDPHGDQPPRKILLVPFAAALDRARARCGTVTEIDSMKIDAFLRS